MSIEIPEQPKVLVVGGGAREHALAWRFAKDGAVVHAAPGNAGIAEERAACVFLHARSYAGPGWAFATAEPAWATE